MNRKQRPPQNDAKKRIGPILRALDKAYPNARTALAYRNPFELLIATILSAQSTDETVNRVTPVLFARFPDARALAAADPAEVERIVYPTGFFRQKTKSIIAAARALVEKFSGEVPPRIEDLVTLPGVGRKTANVVLANCWPRPASDHGIFVDTHVARVSGRLELTKSEDPEQIERDLCELVPQSKWAVFPHQLIFLGRGPCNARNPRHEECPLLQWCPTGRKEIGAGGPSARRGGSKTRRVRSSKPGVARPLPPEPAHSGQQRRQAPHRAR
jgi:endonuclease-3